MSRQFHARALLLVVLLLLLAASAAWATGRGAHAATLDDAYESGAIAVDFDRVVQVPQGLQEAGLQALAAADAPSLPYDHYAATVLEMSDTRPGPGTWAHLVLIPTPVLDSNWELPLTATDPVDIVAAVDEAGDWQAVVKSEATLDWLQANVPLDFMNVAPPPARPEDTYLFPWTAGQAWRVSQTWHGSAIDFFPLVYGNPPIDGAILAMGSGTLSQVCNDGVQAHLRVDHGGLTSGYLHLDAATVRGHDLNQTIPRGRFLGLIYDGEAFFDPNPVCVGRPNLQFSTPCGCGTGPHVHFSSSDANITVDGQNLQAVGSSTGTYTSTNVRDEGPPPPPPVAVTVVNPPALTPAYTEACGSGWEQIGGYEGHPAYVTLNTDDSAQSTNAGIWVPNLPQDGRYQVAAYIANHGAITWDCGTVNRTIPADTTDARYRVTHASGATTVSGNQGPLADVWLALGTYHFHQGTGGSVRLGDLNGEDNLSHTISFSAMRFVLQPPDAPAGLQATDSTYVDRVQLTWNAALGATSYDVYRQTPGAATPSRIGSTTSLSFTDSGAAPGVVYDYTIRALNPAGAGPASAPDPGSRRGPFALYMPFSAR